jgi:hypothetical protein
MPENPYERRKGLELSGPIDLASAHPITPSANNLKTRNGEDYIPRALVCETAGLLTATLPTTQGAAVSVATFPLIAGYNPVGGMAKITAFTGTNLWGVSA